VGQNTDVALDDYQTTSKLFAESGGFVEDSAVLSDEVNSTQTQLMDSLFRRGGATEPSWARVAFRDGPTFSHPFDWTAFSLLGDAEMPMSR
jgi:hypothetical protein